MAQGRNLDTLADAFAETARTWTPSTDKLAKFCGCLGDLADAGGIAFARADVVAYMDARASEGWPAVHHSAAFRAAWRPAYRVVDVNAAAGARGLQAAFGQRRFSCAMTSAALWKRWSGSFAIRRSTMSWNSATAAGNGGGGSSRCMRSSSVISLA